MWSMQIAVNPYDMSPASVRCGGTAWGVLCCAHFQCLFHMVCGTFNHHLDPCSNRTPCCAVLCCALLHLQQGTVSMEVTLQHLHWPKAAINIMKTLPHRAVNLARFLLLVCGLQRHQQLRANLGRLARDGDNVQLLQELMGACDEADRTAAHGWQQQLQPAAAQSLQVLGLLDRGGGVLAGQGIAGVAQRQPGQPQELGQGQGHPVQQQGQGYVLGGGAAPHGALVPLNGQRMQIPVPLQAAAAAAPGRGRQQDVYGQYAPGLQKHHPQQQQQQQQHQQLPHHPQQQQQQQPAGLVQPAYPAGQPPAGQAGLGQVPGGAGAEEEQDGAVRYGNMVLDFDGL